MPRRFPPPWTVERIPGGYKILDAEGQSLAYVYDVAGDASIGKTLTLEEARRIAANIAKLPELLGALRPDDIVEENLSDKRHEAEDTTPKDMPSR
jgi:hypothetical protein